MTESNQEDGAGRIPLLPRFLFRADGSFAVYAIKAAALVLAGHLILSALVALLLPDAPTPVFPPPETAWERAALFGLLVVFAPVVETLLMTVPILILNRVAGPRVAVFGSALLWGVLHSLSAPGWGLVIWWGFLIFSIAFVTWRGRGGYWAGVGAAATIHALNNAVPAILVVAAP